MIKDRIKETGETNPEPAQHYVYIYRDDHRKVRYVGYGKSHSRASSHLSGSHNEALNNFLSTQKYYLEIAGPFDSETTGRAVETALISALTPDFNFILGPGQWRFRPLGISEEFAERLTLPPLERADFVQTNGGLSSSPLLLVRINDIDFDDGRVGYDLSQPPEDRKILERLDRWWQLGSYIEGWMKNPPAGPRTLVGVTGSPGYQIVIGSVLIESKGWLNALRDGALCQVPTQGPNNLDAFNLRGRKISKSADLKFGPNRNQVFLILDSSGQIVCGGRSSVR